MTAWRECSCYQSSIPDHNWSFICPPISCVVNHLTSISGSNAPLYHLQFWDHAGDSRFHDGFPQILPLLQKKSSSETQDWIISYMAIKPNLDLLHMFMCTAKYPKATSMAGCHKLNLIYSKKRKEHWWRFESLPVSSNLIFLRQTHSQPLLWTRPIHLSLAFPAFIFITSNMRHSYDALFSPQSFLKKSPTFQSLFHWIRMKQTTWIWRWYFLITHLHIDTWSTQILIYCIQAVSKEALIFLLAWHI